MVENRPALTVLTHLTLVLGVVIVGFPLYVVVIASTQTAQDIVQNAPMSLWPGDSMAENYRVALWGGVLNNGGRVAPAWPMMAVSLASALTIAFGKIAISLLSAFAIVFFSVQIPSRLFLADFCDPDVAHRSSDWADLFGGREFGLAQHNDRADSAADGFSDGNFFVSPVFLDRARRTRRSRANRWRGTDTVFSRSPAAAVGDQYCGAFRDPVYLWLEPIPLAIANDDQRDDVADRSRDQATPVGGRRGY